MKATLLPRLIRRFRSILASVARHLPAPPSSGTLIVVVIALVGLSASDFSWADTLNRGAEFQEVYNLVHDWATGYLGKTIAVSFLIIGLCIGVLRGSILAAASCLCAAVALLLAPSIIDTMFAAQSLAS